ncbi:hypothetical protein [Okeania hirsuta]|uniref:hypothetical protein n=1 Tax=Okeania hirsuta TaxID=1458930 RepID=UPI001374F408|nr:hypothetical protein [Okeania hirsuta]
MRVFLARSQDKTHPQPLPGGEDRRQEVRGKREDVGRNKTKNSTLLFHIFPQN